MTTDAQPNATDPLLQPLTIKGLTLKNRIMSTSHDSGMGDQNHMPADAYKAYHLEKAKGGLALTMFGGSSFVAPDSTWTNGQLDFSTDAVIPYLQEFSGKIHDAGAALMVQITHLGRRSEALSRNWLPALAPSPVRETLHRSTPREMDRHDIDRVVKAFGEAAYRCKEGGLDGLETMGQGHLIGQFMSPRTNRRTDDFGGSLENRCRFALMVHEEIRRRVGDDYIVGHRYCIDEGMEDGLDFEESVKIAQLLERSGLIDFFNANYGRIDTFLGLAVDCMPGMEAPIAPWLQAAGAFKQHVSLPVFHAARIADIATARHAIREGLLDMVAMTRAHIADPQIVNKIRRGEEDRIRPCVGATHCMGPTKPTCIHNAAAGRELFWPQAITPSDAPGRTVVVVGGGPAGLEAARIAAERGHAVTLFEAATELGGQIRLAAEASWRKDVLGIADWRAAELDHLGVEVRLNSYAETADVMALTPNTVIVATGGLPDLDWLDGGAHCLSTWDVLTGSPTGDRVLVYDGGGRHAALTAAEFLKKVGKSIDLVLLDEAVAPEMSYAERTIWRRRLAEEKIAPCFETRLVRVTKVGNALDATLQHELTGERHTVRCDSVVAEQGTQPADFLYHDLRGLSRNDGVMDVDALIAGRPQPTGAGEGFDLYRIGDAASSRNIAAAIYDALRLCSAL